MRFASFLLPITAILSTAMALPIADPEAAAQKFMGIRLDFNQINEAVVASFGGTSDLLQKQVYDMLRAQRNPPAIPSEEEGFHTVLSCDPNSDLFKKLAAKSGQEASVQLHEMIWTDVDVILKISCNGVESEDPQHLFVSYGHLGGFYGADDAGRELIRNFENGVTYGGRSLPVPGTPVLKGQIKCFH